MKKYSTFDRTFWGWITPFVFIIIFILFLPYLLTSDSWFGLDFSATGQLGDTIGGILGPFIAIVAAALMFIAFWVQYTFNKQQWQSIQIDRLENRIFEMLNLHKHNVSEFEYFNEKGRHVFPDLFRELRYTYLVLEKISTKYPDNKDFQNKETLSSIAYLIFFIGIDQKDNIYLQDLIHKVCPSNPWEDIISTYPMYSDIGSFVIEFDLSEEQIKTELSSLPLKGHRQTLGHYYRHLYQIVKYIADYPNGTLQKLDKYNYIKTIRAQLSDYEQLLLYYNSLSPFGHSWIDNKYLTDYKMIKNIPLPLPLADFGIRPEEKFAKEIKELKAKGEDLFEWSE